MEHLESRDNGKAALSPSLVQLYGDGGGMVAGSRAAPVDQSQ